MNQGIIAAILSIIFYLTAYWEVLHRKQLLPAYSSLEQQTVSSIMGRRAVVLGDKIALRSGPDTTYPAVTALNKGTEVTVLQAENGWYRVRSSGGRTGWVAGNSVALQSTSRTDSTKPMILGYYALDGDSFDAVLDHGRILTSIAPSSWNLSGSGEITGAFNAKLMGESLLFAGNHGLETYAVINSSETSLLLTDPAAQAKAVSSIISALEEWGVHGAHLNLGGASRELAEELTAFAARLAEALHGKGLKLSMAVPAQMEDSHDSAYDYRALQEHLDFLVIMAFGQHHSDTPPGL